MMRLPSARKGAASAPDLVWRAAGVLLVALTVLPFGRMLSDADPGPAAGHALAAAGAAARWVWPSTLVALLVGLVVALVVPARSFERWMERTAGVLEAGSHRTWAVVNGIAAAGVTLLLVHGPFRGRPGLLDAAAQLLQARYLARGRLAGGGEGDVRALLEAGFWYFPNTLLTPAGWVSHFPPGHSFVLAAGILVDAPWLGPVLAAGTSAVLTMLLAARLLPNDPRVARAGGVLGGLAPLLLLQAGALMNHVTAAALGAAAIYCAIRARDGAIAWAVGAGAVVGALLAVRPLGATSLALTIPLLAWVPWSGATTARHALGIAARCGAATMGGVLPLLLHGLYNHRFFGSPLALGYHSTFGEAAGLGFGVDPWGHPFGPREALAYTSSDLTALNVDLLQIPLPVVTFVGVALVLGVAGDRRRRLAAGWAILPVCLGFFYWHHGYFMGPRMLSEFAPAWGLSAAMACAFFVRGLRDVETAAGDRASRRRADRSTRPGQSPLLLLPRRTLEASVLVALLAGLVVVPARTLAHARATDSPFRMAEPPAPEESLVFVTGSWISRINADLAFRGVPQVVMETALRRNPTCLVEQHRSAFHRGRGDFARYRGEADRLSSRPPPPDSLPAPLDLRRARRPDDLRTGEVGQGTTIVYRTRERLADNCVRQIRADERGGAVEAGSFLWLGGLPGIEEGRTIYVRDMGPASNERVRSRYAGREAFVYLRPSRDTSPILVPFDEAMRDIWGTRNPPAEPG